MKILWIHTTLYMLTLAQNRQEPSDQGDRRKFFRAPAFTRRNVRSSVNTTPATTLLTNVNVRRGGRAGPPVLTKRDIDAENKIPDFARSNIGSRSFGGPALSGRSLPLPIFKAFEPAKRVIGAPALSTRSLNIDPPVFPTTTPITLGKAGPPVLETRLLTTEIVRTTTKTTTRPTRANTLGAPVLNDRKLRTTAPPTPTPRTTTETRSIRGNTFGAPVLHKRIVSSTPTPLTPTDKSIVITPALVSSTSKQKQSAESNETPLGPENNGPMFIPVENRSNSTTEMAISQTLSKMDKPGRSTPRTGKDIVPGLPVFFSRYPPRPITPDNNNTISFNATHHIGYGGPVFNKSKSDNNTVQGLCGFPVYNDRDQCLKLDFYTQPLLECEVNHGANVFGFFVVLLALMIIFSNSLLPIVVWRKAEMRTQYDYIKVSLAFADMLTGFVLLGTVLPNMAWSRKASESDVVDYVISDTNSPTAIVVGSFITMSAQSSLLHLAFLSIERFIAIKYSFWHMMRRTRTVVTTLGIIWMASSICSFVPAAFPDYFEYKYQPALLIHLMTLKKIKGASGKYDDYGVHGELYGTFTMLIPYSIMVVFCIMTGVVVYRKLKARKEKFKQTVTSHDTASTNVSSSTNDVISPSRNKTRKKIEIKPEITIFVTIVTMMVAFTATLIPFTIVMFLFTGEVLSCNNYTVPYVITFYVGMTNCFVNAIIYSFRDRRFRKAVRSVFCSAFRNSESQTQSNPNFSQRS